MNQEYYNHLLEKEQILKVKTAVTFLEYLIEGSVIDYAFYGDSLLVLIHGIHLKKLRDNSLTLRKKWKDLDLSVIYSCLPSKLENFVKRCLTPINMIDITSTESNGKEKVIILLNDWERNEIYSNHFNTILLTQTLLKKHFNGVKLQLKGRVESYGYFSGEDYEKYIRHINAESEGERE